MILPKAPAFAKTPRFTSGRAKEALLLATTMSLSSEYLVVKGYQFTTISKPPPYKS